MAQVLCTRENASEEISGVKFSATPEGMLSEDISDEQAADFVAVGGYSLVSAEDGGEESGSASDDRAALRLEAADLGISFKPAWGASRLKSEIAAKKAQQSAQEA